MWWKGREKDEEKRWNDRSRREFEGNERGERRMKNRRGVEGKKSRIKYGMMEGERNLMERKEKAEQNIV